MIHTEEELLAKLRASKETVIYFDGKKHLFKTEASPEPEKEVELPWEKEDEKMEEKKDEDEEEEGWGDDEDGDGWSEGYG